MTTKILRDGEDSAEAITSRTAPTNESQSRHSTLPWCVGEMCAGKLWLKNDVGRPIVLIGVHHLMALEANANARFIVRCVNSHADLLAALTHMTERYVSLANSGDCGNWNPEREADVIAARAAIAKAES